MLGRWIEIILVEKGKVAPSHVYLVSASLSSAGDVWRSLLPSPTNIHSVEGVGSSPLRSLLPRPVPGPTLLLAVCASAASLYVTFGRQNAPRARVFSF